MKIKTKEMKYAFKKKKKRDSQDGSEIGGSRVHIPLHTGETPT